MLEIGQKIYFLDGAMGTLLQKQGLMPAGVPESLNLTHPDAITEIHRSYIRAGSDIIYANTFGVNRYKLEDSSYTVEELIRAGITNAIRARELEKKPAVKVALDTTAIGRMIQPNGDMTLEEAYTYYREIVVAGENAGADLVIFETFTDLLELKAGILAAKENTKLPIFASMSFEANGRTFAGVPVGAAALTLSGLGVDALGINCSLGPEQILPLAREMAQWTNLPILIKPNAGLPDLVTNQYNTTPEEFAQQSVAFLEAGATLLGGCCGTNPAFIEALKRELANRPIPRRRPAINPALCSGERVVPLDQVRIVGERINPTGKKRFKEALLNHEISYILNQALEQTNAGAEILDVNVGVPGIDEQSLMPEIVSAIQSINGAPLQIDSSDPDAIEAALRVYNGKALVNSVNGETKNLERILPIVKKYGAAVIGLSLDENGLPKTAEERFTIAEKIVRAAESYGIPRHDIVIDCLTLTVSAQQDQVIETLKAVKMVKERLGVRTVLGVSNISFGLPDRETINTAFLTLAMSYGLDLPIINPNISAMVSAVHAYNVLTNHDINAENYIARHSAVQPAKTVIQTDMTLDYAVENGIRQAAADATKKLLEDKAPAFVIDTILIPTLEKVGMRFEKGEVFLPQLIQAAGAAQASFEVIKTFLAKSPDKEKPLSKGKIILATVKGDIHDIGKNIVKVILENSGYQIIDLGKDVPPELVKEAVLRENVQLVGLSALMTTTVKSMEETIQCLKIAPDCKIMVGGAVLTESYAKSIGADFYAKDAKAAMDIAKVVLVK